MECHESGNLKVVRDVLAGPKKINHYYGKTNYVFMTLFYLILNLYIIMNNLL